MMQFVIVVFCTWEGFSEVDGRFVCVHSDLVLGVPGGSGGAANHAKGQRELALGYSWNSWQHRHITFL